MKNIKIAFPVALIILCLLSCRKQIVERIPVLTIEKDISIPSAGDIKFISFPSESVGYAAGDGSFFYKTVNGGNTWQIMEVVDYETDDLCAGIEFFNSEEGLLLLGGKVYQTNDGGVNWTIEGDGDFIGLSSDGIGVIGEHSPISLEIRTSIDNGESFQELVAISDPGDFQFSRVIGAELIVYTDYGRIVNLNSGSLSTAQVANSLALSYPSDFYLFDEYQYLVCENGDIIRNELESNNLRDFGLHKRAYYSVDGSENLIICVGERTISTNLPLGNGKEWNEVLDNEANGFSETFFKIKFTSYRSFYLSGSDGLIYKAKI